MNKWPLFLVLLAGPGIVKGQSKPTPPYFTFPGKAAAWTIDVTSDTTDRNAVSTSLHPVKIEVARDGTMTRCRWTWSDGTVNEDWLTPKYFFFQDRTTKALRICNPTPTGKSAALYNLPDESLFRWISSATYSGDETEDGADCYVYKESIHQAWIDHKKRLPVALDMIMYHEIYTYTFLPAPSQPLTLPPQYDQLRVALEKYLALPKGLGAGTLPPP